MGAVKSENMPMRKSVAVLIDADNVSSSKVGEILNIARGIGEPIVRRAYGMVGCFSSADGWQRTQREYGVVAKPQVSNITGKNVADIALVIDAMELLYKGVCDAICVVSSDSDYTALAAKIREGGKAIYGIGGEKTPESFRKACTKFFVLSVRKGTPTKGKRVVETLCPRCGKKLTSSHTKSLLHCKTCVACGGMSVKLPDMRKSFAAESIAAIDELAKRHEQPGCVCPDCGSSMSLVRVASGKIHVEIDVCPKCKTVWYDKDEFEALVPNDGALQATVSAGKAYRRELVLTLTADLRGKRQKVPDLGALKTILKKVYHVPGPDIQPVISALMSQRIIKADKSGKITLISGPS